MAIVVLVLWLFTAGAGFSLLVTSNLSRSPPHAAGSSRRTRHGLSRRLRPAGRLRGTGRLRRSGHLRPDRLRRAGDSNTGRAGTHPGPRQAAEPRGAGPVRSAFPGRGEERASPAGAALAAGVRAPGIRAHRPGVLAGLYVRALPPAGLDRVRAGDGHGMPGPELVRGQHPRRPAPAQGRARAVFQHPPRRPARRGCRGDLRAGRPDRPRPAAVNGGKRR